MNQVVDLPRGTLDGNEAHPRAEALTVTLSTQR